EGRRIVQKAYLVRLPAELQSELPAQVNSTEIRQFVLHPADAGCEVEGAWKGQFRTLYGAKSGQHLVAQGMQSVDKGRGGFFCRMGGAVNRAQAVSARKTNSCRYMTAPNVVREH